MPAVHARLADIHRMASRRTSDALSAWYAWCDARLFPAIVAYVTHRLTILATLALLVPLVAFASLTALVLVGNTYLNVASAAVSSIVLAQSLRHHREHKAAIHELHGKIDALAAAHAAGLAASQGASTRPRRATGARGAP